MKQPNPTVTIESSSSDEEYDFELLVDWRGDPITKTCLSSNRRSRSRSRSRNKKNGTPTTNQFDLQLCRNISSLLVVENTPEVSLTRQGVNTAEMLFAEGSTPSIVLETPISAHLHAEPANFSSKETGNGPSLPTILNKCSGGADVICLESDNESDRHVSGATKEEKPKVGRCALQELKEIAPSTEDAICFLGKRLNSVEGGKILSSGEKDKEDKLVTHETEFVDNGPKKATFESVSKPSSHDFIEEIDLHIVKKTKTAVLTMSNVFHSNKDKKGSIAKSVGINSVARESVNVFEESIDASIGSGDFSMLDAGSNIREMDPIESCSKDKDLSNGVVKNMWIIQNSSDEGPSSDSLDNPINMKDQGINCTIDNAEIRKGNGLQLNTMTGAVEQQLHGSKGRKSREEDISPYKTDLVRKETGNRRRCKDSEIIRKEREEERKCKQEEIARNKREKEEEKQRQKEEKRLEKEEEKMRKASAKIEAVERRKRQKEMEKWEKGKFALKSISAEIDTKVIERGLIAGHLLSRLAEKDFCFHVVSNQVQSSILWKMNMPDADAQSPFKDYDIPYILVVMESEEFCNLVSEGSLCDHVCSIQRLYPGYSICYLTNKLMSFIARREQEQYKNPGSASFWRRPPFEQAFARFVTHFVGVHSRLCLDEAEVADHIVGLTRSLAECQFRRKLTHLSISANGSHVPKDYPNKDIIKKSVWLKALVAIPKIPPKCAVAIAKIYPTMRSLLNVYLDPGRTVLDKEFLLQDIVTEGLLGEGGRRLGPVCSKRVYRILMAQSGNLKTDDVEEGADLFQT